MPAMFLLFFSHAGQMQSAVHRMIYIYIYIYRERERYTCIEREIDRYVYIYIYAYMHITYIYIYMCLVHPPEWLTLDCQAPGVPGETPVRKGEAEAGADARHGILDRTCVYIYIYIYIYVYSASISIMISVKPNAEARHGAEEDRGVDHGLVVDLPAVSPVLMCVSLLLSLSLLSSL